jgi:poly-gamma-glutamate synthesis protein (capsule biosynthesis protein)
VGKRLLVVPVLLGAVLAACSGSDATARPDANPTTTGGVVAPATTTTVPRRSFTIAATGDFLIHLPVADRARELGAARGREYDFGPMLDQVRAELTAADLAVCHLETPLSADNRALSGYPRFNAPRELAMAIAEAGYESCSTASNHSLDRGEAGVRATLDVLDAAGLTHAGSSRSAEEAAAPEMHDVNGVRVALLAYTYGLNGLPLPSGAPWLVNVIDAQRILGDARNARAAGAQFVMVQLQWGQEYQSQPTSEQQSLARTLLASPDVDVIVGHHVHVVQPVERIGDKYVVYGLGNFLSNQHPQCCPPAVQDGVIVTLHVEEHAGRFVVTRVAYTPTWVERGPYLVRPVAAGLEDVETPASVRAELEASWARTVSAIGSLGAAAYGVAPTRVPDARVSSSSDRAGTSTRARTRRLGA